MWLEQIDKENNHKINIFVFVFKKEHFPRHHLSDWTAAFLDRLGAVGRELWLDQGGDVEQAGPKTGVAQEARGPGGTEEGEGGARPPAHPECPQLVSLPLFPKGAAWRSSQRQGGLRGGRVQKVGASVGITKHQETWLKRLQK